MRARYFALIVAFALLNSATGIISASDSIEQLLQRADDARSSNPARFKDLLTQLDETSEQANQGQQERLQYLKIYSLIVYDRKVDEAIKHAKKLFKNTSNVDLKFRAGSLVVNGYAINRNFSEGLRHLDQTLLLRHRVADKNIRHDGINTAAILYNQLGQYKLGLHYANETLADGPNPRARCFAGHLRLESLYNLDSLPLEDASIRAVIDECAALGEKIASNYSRTILARKWAKDGKRDEGIALIKKYLSEAESTGYSSVINEMHACLAELLKANGDQFGAQAHAKKVIQRNPTFSGSLPLVTAYKTMYEIAEEQGDLATTLDYFRLYAEADKVYLNEIKARELAYQIVRHENLQQTQQIELLNRQNEVLQLQQQVQKQNAQNTRLLVLLLLLLLASIGYWAYKTKRVQMSLRRMAETDALTGISNRHHFTQQSELALAQCARAGEDAALVMFDLDHFKSINDRYGHDTGDWVLKRVAAICAPLCRQVDFLGRIGGEEFAMLLIGIDARGAKRLAEDCRVRIAGIDSGETGYRFKPTASFGVTTTALSGYDLAKLLSHADKMLYRAKHAGRNRVFVYEIPVPVQLPVPVGDALDVPAVPESVPTEAAEAPADDRRIAAVS